MLNPEVLKASIEEDLQILDEIVGLIPRDRQTLALIRQNRLDPYWQDLALRGIDQRLHHYYHVIEKILENIFEATGEGLPERRDYHVFLVKQAFLDLSFRPSVFRSENLRDFLDEMRRYRHFFRNIYRASVRLENLERLLEMVLEHHGQLRKELLEFASWLVDDQEPDQPSSPRFSPKS